MIFSLICIQKHEGCRREDIIWKFISQMKEDLTEFFHHSPEENRIEWDKQKATTRLLTNGSNINF